MNTFGYWVVIWCGWRIRRYVKVTLKTVANGTVVDINKQISWTLFWHVRRSTGLVGMIDRLCSGHPPRNNVRHRLHRLGIHIPVQGSGVQSLPFHFYPHLLDAGHQPAGDDLHHKAIPLVFRAILALTCLYRTYIKCYVTPNSSLTFNDEINKRPSHF